MKFNSKYRLTPVVTISQDEAKHEEYKEKLKSILNTPDTDPGMLQALYEDVWKRFQNFKDIQKSNYGDSRLISTTPLVSQKTEEVETHEEEMHEEEKKVTKRGKKPGAPRVKMGKIVKKRDVIITPSAMSAYDPLRKTLRSGRGYGSDRLRITKWHDTDWSTKKETL